jgi:hypothetical protein
MKFHNMHEYLFIIIYNYTWIYAMDLCNGYGMKCNRYTILRFNLIDSEQDIIC